MRQREAVPILDDFKTWLEQTRPQVLPKSPLADALRYMLNQWDALRRYTDTGFLAMDNNATEFHQAGELLEGDRSRLRQD